MKLLVLICLPMFLLSGTPAHSQEDPGSKHVIYVSSIGWHSGIVVPAYALPDSLWRGDLPYADDSHLEIGWGDADYFTHDGFNLWYALKAVFWPTASVLHINPIQGKVEDYYSDTDVVRVDLSDEQLHRLSLYLVEEFELDENGKTIPAAEGFYPGSHFYKGSSSYYFPNNSNVWAARGIKRAGFPIGPIWHQTTGCLLNKVEDFGRRLAEED